MAKPRLRDLGIVIGDLPPGPHNAITDVPGVRVGQTTLVRDEPCRQRLTLTLVPFCGKLRLSIDLCGSPRKRHQARSETGSSGEARSETGPSDDEWDCRKEPPENLT